MSSYRKKNRDYASWFDDPEFQAFVRSIHGGTGSIQDEENGVLPGGTDYANMFYQYWMQNQQNQWQQNMYREDRAWQEEMYERYQSIGGQIDQMRQNGINPAMMYASGSINAPAVQSGQTPSSGSGASAPSSTRPMSNSFEQLMGVFQMLTGVAGTGASLGSSISQMLRNRAQNQVSRAQADNYTADTQLKYQQSDGQMLDNLSKSIDLEFKRYNAQLDQMYKEETINKIRAEISNIKEDTLLKTKTIEVNGKKIELMTQQIDESEQREYLLQMQGMLTRIKKDQQERLGQLQQELIAAQTMMTNAQSVVVKEQQTKAYAEAQIATLEYIKQQELMDGGYVDELLKEMKQGRKRRNADAIIGNICNVLNSIAGFIPTAGGSSYGATSSGNTSVTW
jgi:hypothetical protein